MKKPLPAKRPQPNSLENRPPAPPREYLDIVFFARERWDGVRHRAHHLIDYFAAQQRVFYLEPPVFEREGCVDFDVTCRGSGLFVVTPHLAKNLGAAKEQESLRFVVNQLIDRFRVQNFISWYETADALRFARHLKPRLTVYDYARQSPLALSAEGERDEAALLNLADVILTSTQSMYETVRRLRPGAAHLFPDCPDPVRCIRTTLRHDEPPELKTIPHPRAGVVACPDVPIDFELLSQIAALTPDWSFTVIETEQPRSFDPTVFGPNIYILGERPTAAAPRYIEAWDVALFPIALARGRPAVPIARLAETLALGVPIIATPTTDIVGPLGRRGIVVLAQTAEEFSRALPEALAQRSDPLWQRRCRTFLTETTWTRTAAAIDGTLTELLRGGPIEGAETEYGAAAQDSARAAP